MYSVTKRCQSCRPIDVPTVAITDTEFVNFCFWRGPVYSTTKRLVFICQWTSKRDTEFVNFYFCLVLKTSFALNDKKVCTDIPTEFHTR